MNFHFDLTTLMSFLLVLGVVAVAASFMIGTVKRANFDLMKQSLEAYEKVNLQKNEELQDVKARLILVENKLKDIISERDGLTQLNLNLQLERDRVAREKQGEIERLLRENQNLREELTHFRMMQTTAPQASHP